MTFQDNLPELKARSLAIKTELAQQKRAYFVSGTHSDKALRYTLEAELAELEEKMHAAGMARQLAKAHAVEVKKASYLHLLIQKVQQAGWPELAEDANRESLAKIESLGLMPAYKLSVK